MKGIIGCSADWLEPGQTIRTADGRRMRILRKVDLDAAIAIAQKLGDTNFRPVPSEHFYEVDVDLLAGTSGN